MRIDLESRLKSLFVWLVKRPAFTSGTFDIIEDRGIKEKRSVGRMAFELYGAFCGTKVFRGKLATYGVSVSSELQGRPDAKARQPW